jgi:hypothetical protein
VWLLRFACPSLASNAVCNSAGRDGAHRAFGDTQTIHTLSKFHLFHFLHFHRGISSLRKKQAPCCCLSLATSKFHLFHLFHGLAGNLLRTGYAPVHFVVSSRLGGRSIFQLAADMPMPNKDSQSDVYSFLVPILKAIFLEQLRSRKSNQATNLYPAKDLVCVLLLWR